MIFETTSILRFLLVFGVSLISSFCFFRLAFRFFPKWGLLDNPAPYGHNRAPVPFVGIIFYINFAILSLLLLEQSEKLWVLLILGALITIVGSLDDLDTIFKYDRDEKTGIKKTDEDLNKKRTTPFAVSPKVRLALQIFIGAVVGLTSIKISYISNIFGGILHLDALSYSIFGLEIYLIPLVFTIIWYVLVFNSINWSDGVPGLTTGLSSIALIVIGILTVRFYLVDETPALRANSIFVFSVLAVFLPTMLLAWYYNLTPKLLIGESGSMFISFIIASLAILVGGKVATVATALGVYLIDAFYVIFARILNGKNPLKWDRIHHLHYRLQNIGMSDTFIRNFVYSLSLLFGVAAVFLDKIGKIFLFVTLMFVIVFITKILSLKK